MIFLTIINGNTSLIGKYLTKRTLFLTKRYQKPCPQLLEIIKLMKY